MIQQNKAEVIELTSSSEDEVYEPVLSIAIIYLVLRLTFMTDRPGRTASLRRRSYHHQILPLRALCRPGAKSFRQTGVQ